MKSCIPSIENMPNRVQAVIRAKGGVSNCKMAFQILNRNEISFKII